MKKMFLFLATIALLATISGCSHCKYKSQNKEKAEVQINKIKADNSMSASEKKAEIKSIKQQLISADKACESY
jgi:uncharacterized protein YceK